MKEKLFSIFIDLSKAFDTIDNFSLIKKLRCYGIQYTACELLLSYLSNRKQCVLFNHELSDLSNVCTGVLHGYILGPLLFLIYINDLPYFIKKIIVIMYASGATRGGPWGPWPHPRNSSVITGTYR